MSGGFGGTNPWRIIGGTAQKLTSGASSAKSAAFGSQTRAIMVTAVTNAVHVEIGPDNGTGTGSLAATASSFLVKVSDPPLVLGCAPGDKLAYIQETGAGTLYVIELSR